MKRYFLKFEKDSNIEDKLQLTRISLIRQLKQDDFKLFLVMCNDSTIEEIKKVPGFIEAYEDIQFDLL